MSVRVVRPGLQTTVQDLGRRGYQRFGVVVGGAMDTEAHRIANALVGNEASAATLEITWSGPTLFFEDDTLIAMSGAELDARAGDESVPLHRPVLVRSGATLHCGPVVIGCRAYLAIAGGIVVPPVMQSRSTYVRANLGGVEGRALATGDSLPIGHPSALAQAWIEQFRAQPGLVAAPSWSAGPCRSVFDEPVIRVVEGSELPFLTEASREALLSGAYRVSTESDRMGYRLAGPPLEMTRSLELVSSGVTRGTLQVPRGGMPILLMADCATTGGYPKVAHVISVDLPRVAQLRPGDEVSFRLVTMEEAQTLLRDSEAAFAQLRDVLGKTAPSTT